MLADFFDILARGLVYCFWNLIAEADNGYGANQLLLVVEYREHPILTSLHENFPLKNQGIHRRPKLFNRGLNRNKREVRAAL